MKLYLLWFQESSWDTPELACIYKEEAQAEKDMAALSETLEREQRYFINVWEAQ